MVSRGDKNLFRGFSLPGFRWELARKVSSGHTSFSWSFLPEPLVATLPSKKKKKKKKGTPHAGTVQIPTENAPITMQMSLGVADLFAICHTSTQSPQTQLTGPRSQLGESPADDCRRDPVKNVPARSASALHSTELRGNASRRLTVLREPP